MKVKYEFSILITGFELISLEPLPKSVTVKKKKTFYSIHHNPLMVKFMENMRCIDGLGRGLPMIFRKMKRRGCKHSGDFSDYPQVKVVIYFVPTV